MPGYRALSNSFICQTRSTRHAIVMFQHVAADAICLQGQRKRQVQSQARLEPWDKHKAIIQNQIGVHQYIQYVCYVKQQCWTNMQIMQAQRGCAAGGRSHKGKAKENLCKMNIFSGKDVCQEFGNRPVQQDFQLHLLQFVCLLLPTYLTTWPPLATPPILTEENKRREQNIVLMSIVYWSSKKPGSDT